ncbi:hypothetical protein [Actinomadura fibrosa]|uniref:HEAT repeat domain-containing protein n=3 Tax=Actinomadura fibrosa TaxID=111802 RepID=A0ABW2XWJ6_9ACTN
MDTTRFDWEAVVHRDFDFDLDEPGRRSGAALDALRADLGVTGPEPGGIHVGDWADRLGGLLTAGLPALLRRLDHPDAAVRRILAVALAYVDGPVPPELETRSRSEPDPPTRLGLLVALGRHVGAPYLRDRMADGPVDALGAALALLLHMPQEADGAVVEALTLCGGGEAGAALAELAWSDPEWQGPPPAGPVDAVASWLHPTPALCSAWLALMLSRLAEGALDPAAARVLVEAAGRLYASDRERYGAHASAVASLLGHHDPALRRAAAAGGHQLTAHDGYAEALLRALDDPDVSGRALELLVHRGDPRCVPALARSIRHGDVPAFLLGRADVFAGRLWPDVRARLAEEPPPSETAALLAGTARWPGGEQAVPEVAATLERLHGRIASRPDPAFDELEAASAACGFLGRRGLHDDRALAVLRRVAAGADLETGLAAVHALMGLGEPADEEIVDLLLDVLARSPAGARAGRAAGRRGWRFDSNAAAWLGRLGPRARRAVPALRALRDAAGAAGTARVAAAEALWRVTGDTTEALPVLRAYASGQGDAAAHARYAIQRIEPPEPPRHG